MKKGMCITYEVESGLYINITNKCSNRCSFCIRNNGDGAYGSDSLWLSREPSQEQIVESVLSREISKYSEIVFCGYGEPTYRLDVMLAVAAEIKRHCNIPIRVNTNGHSDLIFGRSTTESFSSVIDSVSISLNAPTMEKYNEICHPVYKNEAFDAVISFAKNVKNYVQNVYFSVVRDFISEDEIEKCKEIAKSLGIPLKIRDYISK